MSSRVFRSFRTKTTVLRPRAQAARLAITLLAVLAFTLHSYVMQIHVHGATWSRATTLDAGKAPQPGKIPANGDQSTCPICQVIAHAGQFATPSAVAISLPALAAFHVAVDKDTATGAHSASHSWNSRAPPRN